MSTMKSWIKKKNFKELILPLLLKRCDYWVDVGLSGSFSIDK